MGARIITDRPSGNPPVADAGLRVGMRYIESGTFAMGSDEHYPEEAPAHNVRVDGFWVDTTPVTNAQFAEFVASTRYCTDAEKIPDPALYPGINPALIQAGSLVFNIPSQPVPLADYTKWWAYCLGAQWRAPLGPDSSIAGLEDHPVVHITHRDASAYAAWAGKSLPTEAEWEFAARGGLEGCRYAWGNELNPHGEIRANYWHGSFPWQNLALDGYVRTSPVGAFPPNGYGLLDMIGNVWEWTDDWYSDRHPDKKSGSCCIPRNPRAVNEHASYDPCTPDIRIPRKVLKGGSHLCAANYCQRYRPAARFAQPIDTSTSHVGFRCVVRGPLNPVRRDCNNREKIT